MSLPDKLKTDGLLYLATPYSKYPKGIHVAYRDAARLAARLMSVGIDTYSPILHTHGMAVHGKISPLNHSVWLKFDAKMMDRCDALLVAKMETWEASFGIAHEISEFKKQRKSIFYIDPESLEIE